MAERTVKYFQESGEQNTEEALAISGKTAVKENINHVVIPTGGDTILRAAEMYKQKGWEDITLIGVTLHAGTCDKYGEPDRKKLEKARQLGAQILTPTHALMGNVEASIKEKFGGLPPVELIAYTYYTFSQGTKVAVEISMNAVDSGLIPAGKKVIALGGDSSGVDTSLILRAVSTVDFFDLRIQEILCKPL